MKISTNKNSKILMLTFAALTAATGITLGLFASDTSAYSKYCVTATCRAAADKAAAASEAANAAKTEANTLQEALDAIDAEIASLQAQITQAEAMKSDLQSQIKDTEAELERDKKAIRTLIVKTNQSSSSNLSAIDILASSDSVSDVVEEGNRQESVEEQLTKAAQQVKAAKEKLEQQKAEVQASIDRTSENKAAINSKRAEQAELKQKYENDAAAYSKEASAASKTVAAEEARKQAEEAQRYFSSSKTSSGGSSVVVGNFINTYPQTGAICPANTEYYANNRIGFYGGYGCQCTSYAGWKVYERYGYKISGWGHAKNWANSARDAGKVVNKEPAPYTVGVKTSGSYGHVVWIERVEGNTVIFTDYNRKYGDFDDDKADKSAFNYYIHF